MTVALCDTTSNEKHGFLSSCFKVFQTAVMSQSLSMYLKQKKKKFDIHLPFLKCHLAFIHQLSAVFDAGGKQMLTDTMQT